MPGYHRPIPNLYFKTELYNTYLTMLLTNTILHQSRLFDYGFIISDIGVMTYMPDRLISAPPELVQPAYMFKNMEILKRITGMSVKIEVKDNKATIRFFFAHEKGALNFKGSLSDTFKVDIRKTLPDYQLEEVPSENHTFLTFSQEFKMTRSERMFASNIEGYVRPKE